MYTAYYAIRSSDGDGELIFTLADEDVNPLTDVSLEWISYAIMLAISAELGEVGLGWFTQRSGTNDFPDIWCTKAQPEDKQHFQVNFRIVDDENNEFHLFGYLPDETEEQAKIRAMRIATDLARIYPTVIPTVV